MIRARTAGATLLAAAHHHPRDARVEFDEETHIYKVDGIPVSRTVSKIASECFGTFDAAAVLQKCAPKWAQDPTSKYHRVFVACGGDKAEATRVIARAWDAAGAAASQKGTALHSAIEARLNGGGDPAAAVAADVHTAAAAPSAIETSLVAAGYTQRVAARAAAADAGAGVATGGDTGVPATEYAAWLAWWETRRASMTPMRTEWSIFTDGSDGVPAIAGQLDALFVVRDDNGGGRGEARFVVADWKCTSHPLTSDSYKTATHPALAGTPDCNVEKFRVQISMYAWILRKYYGVPVRDGLIVRIFGNEVQELPICLLADDVVERIIITTHHGRPRHH